MAEGVIDNLLGTYGFIQPQSGGENHFFHESNLAKGVRFDQLKKGQEVSFELEETMKNGKKSQQAVNVTPKLAQSQAKATTATTTHQDSVDKGTQRDQSTKYPPYRFVPVNTDHSTKDAPVWHDGSVADGLLSGELRCTLKALTPFLPGNARYKALEALGAIRFDQNGPRDSSLKPDDVKEIQLDKSWGLPRVHPNKQIAEPLRLSDGRVVIAGSAIKGMLRHSLSALLSAPMERVGERRYTYRPNLDRPNLDLDRSEKGLKAVCRPALIESVDDQEGVHIRVLRAQCALFAEKGVENRLVVGSSPITKISKAAWKVTTDRNGRSDTDHNRIVFDATATLNLKGAHRVVSYRGGIDGKGLLAKAFKSSSEVHEKAIIAESDIASGVKLTIDKSLIEAYRKTQCVLSDKTTGHLAGHPKLGSNGPDPIATQIKKNLPPNDKLYPDWMVKDQLIYVEVELDSGNITTHSKVLSFGHHFRYRWAYTSSVREKNGKTRQELAPLQEEEKCADVPKKLSAARLFFGYTRNEHAPIGKGVYQRLAGRIAINHAVSRGVPEFLDGQEGRGIPLKPLGMPRASAVEFYLRQNHDGKFVTYGDLPGDAGGDLAGRKFYLHQPGTGVDDIRAAQCDSNPKVCQVRSNQSTLARFVCKLGTEFGFTIRFARLRPWELDALLSTLEPRRLDPNGAGKVYAHKLGLGRPLGMGSVKVEVDEILLRNESATEWRLHLNRVSESEPEPEPVKLDVYSINQSGVVPKEKERKLAAMIDGDVLERWLQLHEYIDRGRFVYPRDKKGEIFGWHTTVRRDYAKQRRERTPKYDSLKQRTNEAINIPEPKGWSPDEKK